MMVVNAHHTDLTRVKADREKSSCDLSAHLELARAIIF